MKVKTQIFLDKIIFKPLGWLANIVVRPVGKILNIDHSLNKKFKRIAVAKFKGLGSILQCTPLLSALKNTHPDCKIYFISTQSNLGLLSLIGTVDEFLLIKDSNIFSLISTVIKNIFKLIRLRPQVYIDLEIYSNFSTLFTIATLSQNRIGFYLRSSSFRMGIYTHMMFFNQNLPISQVYMQIARLLGANDDSPPLFPIHTNLPKVSMPDYKNYIVINVNASDLRLERRWPGKNFVQLINLICEKHEKLTILLIGAPSEEKYVSTIYDEIKQFKQVVNISGTTSFNGLVNCIAQAYFIVTNDTGPMHIAFACNTPAICLFGPCSPLQYGNIANTAIFYKQVYCSPCVHDFSLAPCNGNNVCMKEITVEEVFHTVDTWLTTKIDVNRGQWPILYKTKNETLGLVSRPK